MRVELETFKITKRYKLSKSDEKKVMAIIQEQQQNFIRAWNEYFNCEVRKLSQKHPKKQAN